MSLRNYLSQRLHDLLNERAGFLAKVSEIDVDLAEVRRALAALDAPNMPGLLRIAAGISDAEGEPYSEWTLKQLAVRALQDHFPYGATANQLLAVFRIAYGREIARESLSPQLSRLKDDNIIKLDGKLWKLTDLERETPPTQKIGGVYVSREL
ncbi:MAG: hypothetical protein ABUL43_02295 [Hyphomicrobium sp.]